MADSLLLGGYELLGAAADPEYRLDPNFAFGDGQPDTTTISGLLLDGDEITGARTKNREFSLDLHVLGASRSDLSNRIDLIRRVVDSDTFPLQWTPDGGLPLVWECSKGLTTRKRSIRKDAQLIADLTCAFAGEPFGRSTDLQTIAAATSTSQIDSYATAPTGATLNTTTKYEGTGSATANLARIGVTNAYTRTVSRAIAQNLSAFAGMTLRAYNTGDTTNGTLSLTLTLTSAGGSTSYPATLTISPSNVGTWQLASWAFSAGTVVTGTGVDLTAVTSYSVLLSYVGSITTIHPNFYIDDLRATPAASPIISTTHGGVVLLPATIGSARAPVNLVLTNGSTIAAAVLHSPPTGQDPDLGILTALSTASTNQTVTIAAANAEFAGTYSVVLGVGTPGTGSVTATVTITQKSNGVQVAQQVLATTYTAPLTSSLVPVGDVTLPLRAVPVDNSTTTFDIQVVITGTDRYSDVMLLDTAGQTVIADPATATAAIYVDTPTALNGIGGVYAAGSTNDRTSAFGILDVSIVTGGPILFEPGNNKLLAWVPANAPVVTVSYYPRWLDERVV